MAWTFGLPSLVRSRPGGRLLGIFALTVLLPGLLLVAFAAGALTDETERADGERVQRLGRAGESVAQGIAEELAAWQEASARVIESPDRGQSQMPDELRALAEEPGGLAIVSLGEDGATMWPARQQAYALPSQPPPAAPPVPDSPDFARAERLELRDRDYPTAASLYRTLLAAAPDAERPLLLHRLARTARAAGQSDDALEYLRQLAHYRVAVAGSVPTDLIAVFETCDLLARRSDRAQLESCAVGFSRDLLDGRWSVERPRYLFYAAKARTWLAASGASDAELDAAADADAGRVAITEAAETAIELGIAPGQNGAVPSGTRVQRVPAYLVWSWGRDEEAARQLLVMSASWFDEHVVPRLVRSATDGGVDVSVTTPEGSSLLRTAETDATGREAGQVETRVIDAGGLALQVDTWLRNPDALAADRRRRNTLYLALLGFIALVMASGGYFTVRVVRHELAVAQLKSDFVSAVSHEFRSPLTGIRQLGELLQRGRVPSDDRRQEYYARITQESTRLARMVEHLLDFARMESGRREYRRDPIDVAPWLRGLADAYPAHHAEDALDLTVDVAGDLPAIVGDRDALACAVLNLLDNAVKYSAGRANVLLTAGTDRDGLVVRVRDQGEGISEADRTRIFETFFRGQHSRTRRISGAGIGLSLVHQIVTAHGGRVTCESRVGQGSTFAIHLPVAEPAPEAGSAAFEAARPRA
jgi:signal transduction histidine kinase